MIVVGDTSIIRFPVSRKEIREDVGRKEPLNRPPIDPRLEQEMQNFYGKDGIGVREGVRW